MNFETVPPDLKQLLNWSTCSRVISEPHQELKPGLPKANIYCQVQLKCYTFFADHITATRSKM